MFRENFENKALKNVLVLEPWLDREPGPRKPLFGAVIFEFDGGHSYFFRSPLRYSWPAFDDRSGMMTYVRTGYMKNRSKFRSARKIAGLNIMNLKMMHVQNLNMERCLSCST